MTHKDRLQLYAAYLYFDRKCPFPALAHVWGVPTSTAEKICNPASTYVPVHRERESMTRDEFVYKYTNSDKLNLVRQWVRNHPHSLVISNAVKKSNKQANRKRIVWER
jgi:hypothetical protein